MTRWGRFAGNVGEFFGVDEAWVRPAPGPRERRRDVLIALAFLVFVLVGQEMLRGMGVLSRTNAPAWNLHLLAALPCLPLIWRRRFPLSVAVITQLHMFIVGIIQDAVMSQFFVQVLYFFALYSGVAWARDRRAMLLVFGGILTFMFGWLTYSYAVGAGYEAVYAELDKTPAQSGLLSPFVSFVVYGFMVNILYFGGAVLWGRSSWRSARDTARLAEQAATITSQATELRESAVVEERLRIARELHDVVAHHVSVMGVQAAAARRVLDKDPAAAANALASVEQSSRQAVGEMRTLLGTLRIVRGAEDEAASRAPEPDLTRLPALIEQFNVPGFEVRYDLVEDRPNAVAELPRALSLSMYRIVQEALANVRQHSSATQARVVTRIDRPGQTGRRFAEVEVVDNGRPKGATSGTGLGLLGMRERIANHGGTLDVGPRLNGGYRVRVRFPLTSEADEVSA